MTSECGSRSVYLVTYSQVDKNKVETKEEFSNMVREEFKGCRVERWACCEEDHETEGTHYHLAIKLDRVKRWKMVRQSIQDKYDICVNFSDHHSNYYSAYNYVTKQGNFAQSPHHPDYVGSPQTSAASHSRKREPTDGAGADGAGPSSKRRSIDFVHIYDAVITSNIKNDDDLCNLARREMADGKRDFANFILRKNEKSRADLLKTAWKIHTSEEVTSRANKTRLQILSEAQQTDCSCQSPQLWRQRASEVLKFNDIDEGEFTHAVKTALEKGRGKKQNVMIVGKTNRGKSFLFLPLTKIFKTFSNPATGTFALVGAEKKEVLFLNDFRWSEKVMAWSDLLNLLEGAPVHLSAPKTHFAEDILWTKDTAIFATSKKPIRKYDCGELNEIETEMMDARWNVFYFTHRIKAPITTPECKRCFADFVYQVDIV